jgi:hypothetical protein
MDLAKNRCFSVFPQDLNALRASVFQKLLAKYRASKAQYQDLKKELEKLSGKLWPFALTCCYCPFDSHTSILRCCLAHCFA